MYCKNCVENFIKMFSTISRIINAAYLIHHLKFNQMDWRKVGYCYLNHNWKWHAFKFIEKLRGFPHKSELQDEIKNCTTISAHVCSHSHPHSSFIIYQYRRWLVLDTDLLPLADLLSCMWLTPVVINGKIKLSIQRLRGIIKLDGWERRIHSFSERK